MTPLERLQSSQNWIRGGFLIGAIGLITYLMIDGPPVDLEVYRRGAAQAFHNGDHIYETPYGLLPFTYPPLAIFFFMPLAVLPAVAATGVMVALSLAALYRVTQLVLRRLRPDLEFLVPLVVPLAIALEPIWETFTFGQVNLVLAWVVAEDLLGLDSPRAARWRGVLIGVATGIKLTPGIFALALLFRRDWASLARMTGSFFAGVALGFAVFPESAWGFWTRHMRDPSRVGGVSFSGNQSMNGAVWRALGPGGSKVLWVVLCLVVVLVAFAALYALGLHGDRVAALLVCGFTGLLASPVSWSHHWVWFWPLLLWCALTAVRHRPPDWGMLALGGIIALVGCTRVIWWFPHRNDAEYSVGVLGKILTDSYALVGIAAMIMYVVWAWRVRPAHLESER